jgi:hypothetical protein
MENENEEMAGLAVAAAEVDAENAPPVIVPEGGEGVTVDTISEARAIVQTVAVLAAQLWPFLRPIYTPEVQEDLARAWGPVMDHYGWSAGGLLSHPLAGAALVTFPIAAKTFQAFSLEAEKNKKPGKVPIEHPGAADDSVVLKREAE